MMMQRMMTAAAAGLGVAAMVAGCGSGEPASARYAEISVESVPPHSPAPRNARTGQIWASEGVIKDSGVRPTREDALYGDFSGPADVR